jgi:hypothetical protein
MKASIRARVVGARLSDTVPPLYREAVAKDESLNPQEFYTVIQRAHTERDVVSSPTLIQAFRRVALPAPVAFSLWARFLLRKRWCWQRKRAPGPLHCENRNGRMNRHGSINYGPMSFLILRPMKTTGVCTD